MVVSSGNFKPIAGAGLLLTGLAWTLPFLQPYHRFPLAGFYSEWLAFAFGLAAAGCLLHRDAWREPAIPAVAVAPLALALLLALQAALGRLPYAEQSITAALYLLWAMLVATLGYVLRRSLTLPVVTATLAWFLIAGGLLTALAGVLQYYRLSTPLDFLILRKTGLQIFGNLGQTNHTAAYLALAIAATAYLHAARRLSVLSAAACSAPLLWAQALTGSRSAWLYLASFAVVAVWLHYRRRDPATRRLAIMACFLLPGLVLAHGIAMLPWLVPEEGRMSSIDRFLSGPGGFEARVQLWAEAWRLFLGSPLLGAGWGRFPWHHFIEQAQTGNGAATGVFSHAHNIVLQLLAETGAAGAAIVVAAALLWLADLRRAAPELETAWLLSAAGVIAIHSLLEYPLWYSYFLGIAAFLAGLGAERTFAIGRVRGARLVALVVIIAGALSLASVWRVYREFEALVFTRGAPAARLDDRAYAAAVAALYREPLLVPYVDLAIAYGIEVSADRLSEKLALVDRVVHFAPVATVCYRYALLLALAGEREAALAQLARSLRVYPRQARETAEQLAALAREHPARFEPLLELAIASLPTARRAAP